jgi:hypothetical protein
MKRFGDNGLVIRNYLLGVLPEAERDSFEQSYLEDETLFQELEEIEDELIDDYVNGSLSGADTARFEQYFLRSPGRGEKLAFARAMTEHAVAWKDKQQGLGSAQVEVPEGEQASSVAKVLPFKTWSRPVPAWRQWGAIAAAVLIAIGSGVLWLRNRELRRELLSANADTARLQTEANNDAARANEANQKLESEKVRSAELAERTGELEKMLAQLQSVRKAAVSVFVGLEYLVRSARGGESKVKTVNIPADTQLVKLSVEFEKGKIEKFRGTLKREDTNVWTSGVVKGGSKANKQTVTLTIPGDLLKNADYTLTIRDGSPNGEGEAVARYVLRVVKR